MATKKRKTPKPPTRRPRRKTPKAPGLPRGKPRSKQFGKPKLLPPFDPDKSPIKRRRSVPA